MQHGDSFNAQFTQGLPSALRDTLIAASRLRLDPSRTVQICHSEPGILLAGLSSRLRSSVLALTVVQKKGAWWVPTPNYHTAECPSRRGVYKIGRTMFETGKFACGSRLPCVCA